jgi:hypothetical protein
VIEDLPKQYYKKSETTKEERKKEGIDEERESDAYLFC